MATLFVMEAANLFCGDHDPTKSKHLSLSELKLVTMEGKYEDHHAGGSLFEIEVELGFKKAEAGFKLKGFDPDVLMQFGLGTQGRSVFTAYGVVRDKKTNRAYEMKSVIEARLGKAEPDEFKRGDFMGYDYKLNEIFSFALTYNEREIYFWDFLTQDWRVNGVSQNADERRILRIPGA